MLAILQYSLILSDCDRTYWCVVELAAMLSGFAYYTCNTHVAHFIVHSTGLLTSLILESKEIIFAPDLHFDIQ